LSHKSLYDNALFIFIKEHHAMGSSTENAFEQGRSGHKYDEKHAKHYLNKHVKNRWRRFGNWCEQQMFRRSLKQAGMPLTILDIPCGTGRFWPTMQHHPAVSILAADYNAAMLDVAAEHTKDQAFRPTSMIVASAFKIPLGDNAVENISCLRLIHHVPTLAERQAMLAELHRVTANTVCISLQVDKNWYSFNHLSRQKRNPNSIKDIKYIFHQDLIEQELRDAGFIILGYADKWKGISAWRCYTLKKIHKPTPFVWYCPACQKQLELQEQGVYRCATDNILFKQNAMGILDLSLRHAEKQ